MPWRQKVLAAVATVVAVGVGVRLAWELVAPYVPALIVAMVILSLMGFVIGRWRR